MSTSKNYFRAFFRRISKDFKHKELLPVKVLFFVHMSTILVMYPYLSIHMRELGINVEETAIMSAVTPVVGILMPPMAGLLADKIGNFKVMLALFSVFSGLSALLLLLVPIGRVTVTYPDKLIMGVACNANHPLSWSSYDDYPCDRLINSTYEAEFSIESCGYFCTAYLNSVDDEAIFRTQFYDIKTHVIDENRTTSLRYHWDPKDYTKRMVIGEATNHEILLNNEKYSSTIRKLSRNSYFFPTPSQYNFSCQLDKPQSLVYNNSIPQQTFEVPDDVYGCVFDSKTKQGFTKSLKVGVKIDDKDEDSVIEEKRRYQTYYIKDQDGHKHNMSCLNGFAQSGEHVVVSVILNKDNSTEAYKDLDLGSCAPRCIATTNRKNFCKNDKTIVELDINLTFWSYLAVRVFIGIIGGTAYTMFEGAVIAILREYKADYGLQRMYASFGGMISSPLSGLLVDYASQGKSYTDFRPIFFLYAGLKVISAVLMLFINLEFKSPATSIVADVMSLLNVELVSLFVAVFLLGCAWGYIENFLFWLLQDLGGTKSLMGLTITVGGIIGIPLLALSGPIIKRFGHANIIFLGFITYAVRLFGYSIIYNPWLSLIFEALECVTHSLCLTAAITYAAKLSTNTTDTTIQGILGGLFYGVGRSAGSLIGGYLIKYVGIRLTFQIFSGMTAVTAFLYLSFYHIYMKNRSGLHKEAKEDGNNENVPAEIEKPANVIKAVPFEDPLTNLAFENTETDSIHEDEAEEKKTDVKSEGV